MKLGVVGGLLPVDNPDAPDALLRRIEKAAAKGCNVMGAGGRDGNDADLLKRARDLAASKGVELRGGGGGDWYLEGDEAKAEIDRVAERLRFLNKHLGIKYSSTPAGPMSKHRWMPGPPLEERKQTIAKNLAQLCDAVADIGFTIALENHCDWRGHECVDILKKANRKNLMFQIDTGNAFSVFEEPVDCAKAMAPWVVSSHLKDVAVEPFARGEVRGSRVTSVALGDGHTDNYTICKILAEKAPDSKNLAHMIEPFYLDPGTDVDAYCDRSLAWARKHLAEFLS